MDKNKHKDFETLKATFIRKHNGFCSNPSLKVTLGILELFLEQAPRHIVENLNVDGHRRDFLDWLLDNTEQINKSRPKPRKIKYDLVLSPAEIQLGDPETFDEGVCFAVECDRGGGMEPLLIKKVWEKLCLTTDGKMYYRRSLGSKRYVFKELLTRDFLKLDLPYLHRQPEGGYHVEEYKRPILDYLSRYGYPMFSHNPRLQREFLQQEDLFFRCFILRWNNVQDLLRLKARYPSFPKIPRKDLKLDNTSVPRAYLEELIKLSNAVKRPLYRHLSKPKAISDWYDSLLVVILDSIIFPSEHTWKQCGHCGEWFLPKGKSLRGCCPGHAKKIRDKLYRAKRRAKNKKATISK